MRMSLGAYVAILAAQADYTQKGWGKKLKDFVEDFNQKHRKDIMKVPKEELVEPVIDLSKTFVGKGLSEEGQEDFEKKLEKKRDTVSALSYLSNYILKAMGSGVLANTRFASVMKQLEEEEV